MKRVIKSLLISLVVMLVGICGFYHAEPVYADEVEEEPHASSYLVDDSHLGFYLSNTVAGRTSGYSSDKIGSPVTIITQPEEGFIVRGWYIKDSNNSTYEWYLEEGTVKEITYTKADGNSSTENITFSILDTYGTKTVLEISKLWSNLEVEPIFDRIRYSIKMPTDLKLISSLTEYENDENEVVFLYRESEETGAGYTIYKNVFYFVGADYYYIGEVYKDSENKLLFREARLQDDIQGEPNEYIYFPLSIYAYVKGSQVDIIGDINLSSSENQIDNLKNSTNIQFDHIYINGVELENLDEIVSTENIAGTELTRATGYNIETIINANASISIDYKRMYVVDVNITHEGADVGGGVNSYVTLPDNLYRIGETSSYLAYKGARYKIVAKNVSKIIDGKTYQYFTTNTNTIEQYLNGNVSHDIEYTAVRYNVKFEARLYTPQDASKGYITSLQGVAIPSTVQRYRGQGTLTLDSAYFASEVSAPTTGYTFAGYMVYTNGMSTSGVTLSPSLDIEIDDTKPSNITVLVCFKYTTYTIVLDQGSLTLNGGAVTPVDSAYTTKNKNQKGVTYDSEIQKTVFLESVHVGDTISFKVSPNPGFVINGLSIGNTSSTGVEIKDLRITPELINSYVSVVGGKNTITLSVDASKITYTIKFTRNNSKGTLMDGDDDVEGDLKEYTINLYESVNLKSRLNDSETDQFVGYYIGKDKLTGVTTDEYNISTLTFTLNLDNINKVNAQNTLTIQAKYQSRTLSITIKSNETIKYKSTFVQGARTLYLDKTNWTDSDFSEDAGWDIDDIQVSTFTITVSNIQFGYELSAYSLTRNDGSEEAVGTVVRDGDELTITITNDASRTLELEFTAINYNVVVKDGINEINGTINVKNPTIEIVRPDNRYYVNAIFVLDAQNRRGGQVLPIENNNSYLEKLAGLKNAQNKTFVKALEADSNNVTIVITPENSGESSYLDLKNIVKNYLVDDKIVLQLEYKVARYTLSIEPVVHKDGWDWFSNVEYYFNLDDDYSDVTSEDYVTLDSKFISKNTSDWTYLYEIPIESYVKVTAPTNFPEGMSFDSWKNGEEISTNNVYTVSGLTQDISLKLSFADVKYNILLNINTDRLNDTGFDPNASITNNLSVVNGATFRIETNNENNKASGVIGKVFYYLEYLSELGEKEIYTRETNAEVDGGYVYTLYEGEIDEDETYYYRVDCVLTNGNVSIEFNPANYMVESGYSVCFYAEYRYITVSFNITTEWAGELNNLLADPNPVEYSYEQNGDDVNISEQQFTIKDGIISIIPELQSVTLSIGQSEEIVKVDLNTGVSLPDSINVGDKTIHIDDGKYNIDLQTLYGSLSNDGVYDIKFIYTAKEKSITLETQIDPIYTNFYTNLQMKVGNVLATPGQQQSFNFLTSTALSIGWQNDFDNAYRIRSFRLFDKNGNELDYVSDPTVDNRGYSQYGLSTNQVGSTPIYLLLVQDIKVQFQVEIIIGIDGADITENSTISTTFKYQKNQTSGEFEAIACSLNDIKNRITVHSSIKSMLSIPKLDPNDLEYIGPTYAGRYQLEMKFHTEDEDYEWLNTIYNGTDFSYPKFTLVINPLVLEVKYGGSADNHITITYNNSDNFSIANYGDEIINKLYFASNGGRLLGNATRSGDFWINTAVEGDLGLHAVVSDKNVGNNRNISISGMSLRFADLSEDNPLKDSIQISNTELEINSILNIVRKEVYIYGYEVYDKIYDGEKTAVIKDSDKISVSGLIDGDDIRFDATKLQANFTTAELSQTINDKTILITAGESLSGESVGNYSFNRINIPNRNTIYPDALEVSISDGTVRLENRVFANDPTKANLIPVGADFNVIEVVKGDKEYVDNYKVISKKLNASTVYKKGYVIELNKAMPNPELTLILTTKTAGKTLYKVVGDSAIEVDREYDKETSSSIISVSELEGAKLLFMVQTRNTLKPWQIVLIVSGSVAVVGGSVTTVVLIRKRKVKAYSKNDKI